MYSSITLISFAIIILICYVLDKISVFSAILFILVSMVTTQSAYYVVLLRLLYSLSIVLSENVWFIGGNLNKGLRKSTLTLLYIITGIK